MINTITLNPALDYFVELEQLRLGNTNRAEKSFVSIGGKGINVAVIAARLGMDVRATGFVAGFTGDHLLNELSQMGIDHRFVKVDGLTRINVKLKETIDQLETELNGCGMDIGEKHLAALFDEIEKFPSGEFLVLSGNVPNTIPADIYAQIMEKFAGKFQFVLDTSGEAFAKALPFAPFLIKPNIHELIEFFGEEIDTSNAIEYCKKLQHLGARNVLLSLGAEGAILLTEEGFIIEQAAAEGKLVASSGAGDSMVAGFLAGWIQQNNYDHALKLGAAAGGATAFSEGLAQREIIDHVFGEI